MALSPSDAVSIPKTGTWRDRIRALGPALDASGAANENLTELPKDIVKLLDDLGVFDMMAPRDLGGTENHPDELIDAISELSYWDGSTGWYAQAVMTGASVAGAFLGERAVKAIFPNGKFAHAAGQAAPTGKAVREGEGYRISGRYSFGSGTPNAKWIVGGYVLHQEGKPVIGEHGQPVMLIGLAPRDKVTFKGNWNVLGLRGTGSYDFEVNDQVLHEDFFFDTATAKQLRGGALYRMGFLALPCLCHGSFAVGATRRMIDEWKQFARSKLRANGKPASEMATVQRDIAMAMADQRAAEDYLRGTLSRLFDAAEAGKITEEMKLDGRLATSHCFVVAMRIAQAALSSCTTTAIRDGSALQRTFRDIHTGNAHFLTGEQSFIDSGKVILGVEDAALVF